MKFKMGMEEGRSITAAPGDNPTARDFASLLPLTLTLKDYASTEKLSGLPKRLSMENAPDGFVPPAGDVAYYAPWGQPRHLLLGFPLLARPHQARPPRWRPRRLAAGRTDRSDGRARRPADRTHP